MQREEHDDPPFTAGVDPDEWAWIRGVNYVAGWRAAKDAADALNTALLACDLWPWELRAVADTDASGSGRVRLVGSVDGTERLARVLRALRDTRGGQAPAA